MPEQYFKGSGFPILKAPMKPKDLENKIGCIHPRGRAIIRRLQPYEHLRVYWLDPLWQLHQLNIGDKHRLPNVVQFATAAGAYLPDSPTRPTDLEVHMGPITDGRRVATYTPRPDEPADEVHTEFVFLENLQFSRNYHTLDRAVSRTLHRILARIRDDVLPPLAQYLPDPEWFDSVMQ